MIRWSWYGENIAQIIELTLMHVWLAAPPILAAFLVSVPLFLCVAASAVAGRHRRRCGPVVRDSVAGAVTLPLVLGTSVLSPLNVQVALAAYGVALMTRTAADAFGSVPGQVRRRRPRRRLPRVAARAGGRIAVGRAGSPRRVARGVGVDGVPGVRRLPRRRARAGVLLHRRVQPELSDGNPRRHHRHGRRGARVRRDHRRRRRAADALAAAGRRGKSAKGKTTKGKPAKGKPAKGESTGGASASGDGGKSTGGKPAATRSKAGAS